MRELLSEAIKRIEKLPPDLQDEIAKQIMDDVENERNWQETLNKPQKKIERLAEKALENSKAGKTEKSGFDKLLGPGIRCKERLRKYPSMVLDRFSWPVRQIVSYEKVKKGKL